jgi:HEAT repeat protein
MMAEDLRNTREIMRDMVCRLSDPDESVRDAALETLVESTWDEDWSPHELIKQDGIASLIDLLSDENPRIVESALDVLIAVASAGEEEALIQEELIARLDEIADTGDPAIQEKVRRALWLVTPEVEDVVMSKPEDEY